MSVKYIIDNADSSLSEQIITGDLLVTNIISGTTFFGDGSGLTGVSGAFTGGTVPGPTEFTSGLSADTINANYFIGDGSQLAGVVGLTYTDLGFTVTSPAPATINQNVVLPYNSTVTYPTPLTVDPGFSVTVPAGTTLSVI
jgi:hypothetical protein